MQHNFMNKVFRLVLSFLLLGSVAQAQMLKLGIDYSFTLVGSTSDKFVPDNVDEIYFSNSGGIIPSVRTGLTLQFARFKHFGLESGLKIDINGWKFSDSDNPTLGEYNGNTLNVALNLPLLAYYKLRMKSGGSYIFGGGLSFDFPVSGIYRYRQNGSLHGYRIIENYKENINMINQGYTFLIGIEDSENSQLRVSYTKFMTSITKRNNPIYPYNVCISFIRSIN